MAKITIVINEEEKTLQTDDFNDEQKDMFDQAQLAERELLRYKYLVNIFEDRKSFILSKLVMSVDKEEEVSDAEEA